jgi:hypothetical protein
MPPPTLDYRRARDGHRLSAFEYVTAAVNGIVVFFVVWFLAAVIVRVVGGDDSFGPWGDRRALFGMVVVSGGAAIGQFRRALRLLAKKAQKRRK